MDLAWCPVCDKQNTFADFDDENLYCSEACRKKDALSSSILDEMSYEFPRCSRKSRKPYQSPHNSSYNSPESSPMTSPKLYPSLYYTTPVTDSFSLKSISYSKSYKMSSSPSDLLLHGKLPSPSMANQRDFIIIHQIRQR